MKKIKKMLAGLLGAAMVLTSFGTPAWASPEEPVTTDATINFNQKGSITIHKYEYNGDGGVAGTGETTDNVPTTGENGAKPLAGAGFTIYKVAGKTEIEDYYSKNPKTTNLTDVNAYTENGKIKSAYSEKVVKVDDTGAANADGNKQELITGTDGTVSFTHLDVGFYVVIETTKPDKVTVPAEPFIVSIPMTITKEAGSDWLYDVNVYPKNKTTYGNVDLVKIGNGDEKTKLEGVTFVLQKQTSNGWSKVEASEQNPNVKYDDLKTDAQGKISISGLSQGTYRFIETDRGGNSGYIMDGATAYKFVVKAEVKDDGKTEVKTYTYGADGKTLVENSTITVDNKKPDMTKQVKDRASGNWQQDSDYNVGDKIPYKITIDVPENITQLKEFTLTDTPTNLKDDITNTNFKVQYKDKGENSESQAVTNDNNSVYTVVQNDGEKGFKVTFKPANMATYAGKQIVITYSAELLDTAVKTTAGNPNTATLEYSNKILPDTVDDSNPNKPSPTVGKDKIEDSTVVYTFNLKISKKADSADGSPLSGVKFDLYKKVPKRTDGALTDEEVSKFGFTVDKDSTWKKVETLTTGTDGTIAKTGLANGDYYLVETKAAAEYNLLKSPVAVKLHIAYKTTWTESTEWTVDENRNATLVKHTKNKTTFAAGTDANKEVDATGEVTAVGENDITTEGTMTETIINRKGFTLPKTGDIGTAMFLIIGIGGMLAAVYIMLRGRKRA
ncbi:SpaH/EbpB family LPXTG-anchored major pilin [Agathobacter sp.]|uniref:SpaH/EbpB family LPXTG-anchored major pilin n=1 Tax=Agathobacter sp. TaxID=2021311 RepID=UPI003FD8A5E6